MSSNNKLHKAQLKAAFAHGYAGGVEDHEAVGYFSSACWEAYQAGVFALAQGVEGASLGKASSGAIFTVENLAGVLIKVRVTYPAGEGVFKVEFI